MGVFAEKMLCTELSPVTSKEGAADAEAREWGGRGSETAATTIELEREREKERGGGERE